jgi:hypothetical protein
MRVGNQLTHNRKREVLLPLLIFFLTPCLVANAQNENHPYGEFGETKQGHGLVALYNMTSQGDCHPVEYVGAIVAVRFDEEFATQIQGFTIADKDDDRTYFNFEAPEIGEISYVTLESIPFLIKKGRRVRVSAFACGAAGRVLMANHIVNLDAISNRRDNPPAVAKKSPTPSRGTDSPSPFVARYVGGNRVPEVEITNNADRTLSLTLGRNKYQITPSTSRKIVLESGVYEFQATAPRTSSLEGRKEFERGYVYTWTFYIVTRTRTSSSSPRIIPRRRGGRRP